VTIRPLVPEDAAALVAAFDRLSAQSRYQRFLGYKKELSVAELAWFTNLDHVDREAIAAFDAAELVGVARYVRDSGDPTVGDVAVTVADGYQSRGLGTLLLQHLVRRAADEGLTRFRAVMLAENRRILALLRRTGGLRYVRHTGMGVLQAEVDLPARPPRAQHLDHVA
jgi:GNAT superfamily N-acetyltransferase